MLCSFLKQIAKLIFQYHIAILILTASLSVLMFVIMIMVEDVHYGMFLLGVHMISLTLLGWLAPDAETLKRYKLLVTLTNWLVMSGLCFYAFFEPDMSWSEFLRLLIGAPLMGLVFCVIFGTFTTYFIAGFSHVIKTLIQRWRE